MLRIWIRIRSDPDPFCSHTSLNKWPNNNFVGVLLIFLVHEYTSQVLRAYFRQKKISQENLPKIYLGQDTDVFESRIRIW
jgi:hypothetical protein